MSAVPGAPAPTRNTWTCPMCRHGSPDPRDEIAHVDAHRQLGLFLDEWDAAVVSDREKERNRHPAAVVLAGSVALMALVTAVVLWGFGPTGGGGSSRPAPPIPVPAQVPAPSLAPPAPASPDPAPDTSQLTAPAQAAPQSPPSTPSAPPPAAVSAAPVVAPAVIVAPGSPTPAPPAPSRVISPQTFHSHPPAAPPAYLLQLCVFGTCLTIP